MNLESLNSEDTKKIEAEFNNVVQLLIDGYLLRKNQPKMADILKSQNKTEEFGVLTEEHIKFLQQMIQEEAAALSINISEEVRKSGATYELGKLSNIEKQYLYILVDNLLGALDIVRQRQEKK